MSVIHTVLTRLDARRAPRPSALGALPPVGVMTGTPSKRLPVMAAFGAALIAFTALADWPHWLRSANAKPATPATAAADAAPPLNVPVAPAEGVAAAAPAAPSMRSGSSSAEAPAPPRPVAAARRPARLAHASAAAVRPQEVPAMAPPTSAARIDKRDIAPTPAQRAQALLRQASEAAQAGQPRTAIERARAALAIDPALAAARLLAAMLEHETGASERAAQLLRDGLQRDGRDGAQALLLARILIAQGDATAALATLQRHDVRGAEADGLRGGILTQQGDSARAVPAYESAVRQQPGNAMWWLGLGVALDAERQPQRARQAYTRALASGLPSAELVQYADQRLRAAD